MRSSSERLILHVSAKNEKFLQLADELEIMKKTKSGVMKNFNISCLDDFFLDGNMDVDNLLTAGDRQIIIKHALDSIKATEHETRLPGTEVTFYHGESIINACLNANIIECVYALQDKVSRMRSLRIIIQNLLVKHRKNMSRNSILLLVNFFFSF